LTQASLAPETGNVLENRDARIAARVGDRLVHAPQSDFITVLADNEPRALLGAHTLAGRAPQGRAAFAPQLQPFDRADFFKRSQTKGQALTGTLM
jgi:hypothetical protein